MSTLGKRKERTELEPAEQHGSTLFVSNLPYTATSTDLQTLFSDLAPVRSAFVVTEHGTGVSKGVGYVSFSTREDAAGAMGEVSEKGLVLQGRGLRVAWAANKQKKDMSTKIEEVKQEEPEKKHKSKPKLISTAPRDPDAIRTVVVSGLPSGVDAKTLWKKFRKQSGASSVSWPAPTPGGGEDASVAHVLFENPTHAFDAVQKLHAHVFKGALLSATLKKRLDGVARPAAKEKAKGPAPSRASRLIVRNLPFDVTEQDIRALFLPYGTIYSVHIPQAKVDAGTAKSGGEEVKGEGEESTLPPVRGKGFAFVWMWTKREAEKAMEGTNGKTVRAGMAEEMVRDKQMRKKARREAKKGKEGGGEEEAEEGKGARVIAVDWALSKDKWEEEKQKIDAAGGDGADDEQEAEDANEEERGEDDEDSESDEEGSHIGIHNGSGTEDEDGHGNSEDEDDDRSDAGERAKLQLPAPEAGTTLFVRNILFEATEDELRTLFRAFGPLRYARITMDHATGRSRGTGFVCFWNKDDADKAVEQSAILRAETAGQSDAPQPKKNPFAMPSILTPDPSALSAQSLVLHGRTLDVVRAVPRDEATRLKEEGEKAREKADKRNMYLLREGVVLPNTPAAEAMLPTELEKRTNSFNARRTLLKSNPSLYVSKTRLSIRQLPLFVTESLMRRMARHALHAFEDDVKAGRRSPLSAEELAADKDAESADKEGTQKAKAKAKEKKTGRVKQAKVVRQQDRIDQRTGLARSKGYGFVEMRQHADALRVLRWANNNAELGKLWSVWEKEERKAKERGKEKAKEDAGGKSGEDEEGKKVKGTLIVEFSIENVQVVQRRATKEKEARTKSKEQLKPREKLTLPKRRATADTAASVPKKRRKLEGDKAETEDSNEAGTVDGAEERKGKSIGSLIGRKRKERKARAGR